MNSRHTKTIAGIMSKLRQQNKMQYRLLGICILLSVLLVSSFSLMYWSKTVQELLPIGGDTRSLSILMLSVTILGCVIFTLYGAGLFFRYRSRELGVFLALGETKSKLKKQFGRQLLVIISQYSILGLLLSIPLSYVIWKLFSVIALGRHTMKYEMQLLGLLPGILFSLFLLLCVTLDGYHYIKKTNIITILNAQKETESIHEIPSRAGKIGLILAVSGLFLAMGIPSICTRVFLHSFPAIWNLTYLISAVGIYLFLLSAVAQNSKGQGRSCIKYYKNIISTNLMRFTARQTTRNMCVISLLLFVLLIAGFWGVQYYQAAYSGSDLAIYSYTLHYPSADTIFTKNDFLELAASNDTILCDYHEITALNPVIVYAHRDLTDDHEYIDLISEKNALFLSSSDFTSISGIQIAIPSGEYRTLVPSEYQRSIWYGPDCLQSIQTEDGDFVMPMEYGGTITFDTLLTFSDPFIFILSDEDYCNLQAHMEATKSESIIMFNVNDVASSLPFANACVREMIHRSTPDMKHYELYDAHEEVVANASGQQYSYSPLISLDPDDPRVLDDWKYAPSFQILYRTQAMQLVAIFVLLSIYIAIISLSAIGVMTYVRGVTIAIDNLSLFHNLKCLGANSIYICNVIRNQLRKIIVYPGIAGSGLAMTFTLMMTIFNDLHIMTFEIYLILMMLGLIGLSGIYLWIIYHITYKKMLTIAQN